MLVSDVMVISRLIILYDISMEFMGCFNKGMQKKGKNDIFRTSGVGPFYLLQVLICLILNTSFMDSLMI